MVGEQQDMRLEGPADTGDAKSGNAPASTPMNAYIAPPGGASVRKRLCATAREIAPRDSCSRPPGATSSRMLWNPPSAVCTAHCAGTLLQRRSEARSSSAFK